MKKAFLVLGLLALSSPAQAFWTNTENLERQSQVIRVDHRNAESEVIIEEIIKNPTDTAREYRYLAPIKGSANLYQDGRGLNTENLTGPTLLKKLWEYVETDRSLLHLGTYHDQGVLISEPITINPGESTQIKLKYRAQPDNTDGVNLLTVDVADRLNSQIFETSFNIVGSNRHFLPPLHLSGDQLTENSTTTWLAQASDYVSDQPLTFLWSNQDSPKVHYRYGNHDYQLQLETPPAPTDWQTVTILIDQSGSMFGERWEHSQVLVKEFLKKLPTSTRFRVGFFDNEVSWFHDVTVENTAAEQKKIFDWWNTQIPTGKTDWSLLQEVLRDLQLNQSALSKSAGLIIGDFSQFEINDADYYNLKSFRRSLLLDFTSNDLVSFWSRLNDGQYQTILSQDEELAQWPLLWKKWQHLHLPKKPPNSDALPAEINFFPEGQSLLWLSRQLPTTRNLMEAANFIPRLWEERQLASQLRREAIVGQSSNLETWEQIWSLEDNLSVPFSPFYQNGIPLLRLDEDTWGTSDFDSNFPLKSGIEVAPDSIAERQLFYFFPDLVGTALSLGKDLNFCGAQRCLQLDPFGETTPEETHKLDWRARLKPHWANDYALELARKNTVTIDPFGEMRLDQPVTRGEFIRWLVEWYFGTDFTERTAEIGDPRFTDITDESTTEAEAIYLLRRKGVIQGYPDGTVRPDKPLARAEAVKIILALDGFEPSGEHEGELPFRDIGGWEAGWVVRAKETGLVQGYGDGTFKPFQPLTRGEGMKLVVSF